MGTPKIRVIMNMSTEIKKALITSYPSEILKIIDPNCFKILIIINKDIKKEPIGKDK